MSRWVSGVLLAAGSSRRFADASDDPVVPKQLRLFQDEPLVRRSARAALASALEELVVVVGHRGEQVEAVLRDLDVRTVRNPRFAEGQSTSVQVGLRTVSTRAEAALFIPCDQPFLDSANLDRIVWAYGKTRSDILVPAFRGRKGAPVLFGRRFFPRLLALEGDVGGRVLIHAFPREVTYVSLESERPLLDADTPEELDRLRHLAEAEETSRPELGDSEP